MNKKIIFGVLTFILLVITSIAATACQYYLINVTGSGATGAQFGDGFTLYSGLSGSGTNVLNTYVEYGGSNDSMGTGGGWTWCDGAACNNLSTFSNVSIHGPPTGNRPYLVAAKMPGWIRYNLTASYPVLSGQFEGQADANWKISSVQVWGGYDGQNWPYLIWNGSLDVGNTLYTFNTTGICTPVGASNFTITTTNNYGETLNTFNASIDGTYYSTTTGTLTTDLLDNSTVLHNVTVFAINHDNRSYLNYNISSNLAAVLNFSYYRLFVNVTNYDNTAVNKFSVSANTTQVWNTTTGSLIINLTKLATYSILVDPENYTTNTTSLTLSSGLVNHTITVWPTNTVNLTFYNETSGGLFIVENVTAYLIIGDTNSSNETSQTGHIWIEDLTAGSYEIRYSTPSHDERSYFFTLVDRTYTEISLYILDDNLGEDITNTLYDEFGNTLEGYYIKLLKYYPLSDAYLTVDEGRTNFAGVTILRATRNGPYYKFRITNSSGHVFKTTSSTQIYDTTLTHYITLGSGVGGDLTELGDLSYSLVWLSATNQFRFNFDQSDGSTVTARLDVYTVNPSTGDTLYNTTSVNSGSGTLYLAVLPINETTYKAKAYITFSGDSTPTYIAQLTHTFSGILNIFGSYGLLLSFIVIIAIVCLGLYNPAVATILVPVALILTRIARLHVLEWYIIVSISAVAIIIIYLISDKT